MGAASDSFVRKGHVLIVDDLPDWRSTLSGLLLDAGYSYDGDTLLMPAE